MDRFDPSPPSSAPAARRPPPPATVSSGSSSLPPPPSPPATVSSPSSSLPPSLPPPCYRHGEAPNPSSASAARRSPPPAIVSSASSLPPPPPPPAAVSSALPPSPPPLATIIMDEGAPHKRAIQLLRKRYRLPASLILFAIPRHYLSAWEESEGKVNGLVSSVEDAEKLMQQCQVIGCSEIGLYYAQFLSLRCATIIDPVVTSVRNVRILNPRVAKEKLRLASVLRSHHYMLDEMAQKVQDEVNLQELIVLRCNLAHELERCTCMLERLLQMKMDALDRLLLLVLVPGAASADLAEGLWVLEHHRPSDHSIVVHPDDGTISWPAIDDIQQRIKDRLGNRLPIDDTLVKVRANVLGVFGRYHFESKLQLILENTRAALQKYMIDPTSKAQVIQTMNAQLKVLEHLINKRSLVGCYRINLPGEPISPDSEGEDDGNESQNGEARSNASDGESSGSSNAYAESSITLNSIVSTDSEFYDSDILVMQSKGNEDGQDIEEIAVEEDDGIYDESGAIMEFSEIDGESEDARAKRFDNFCTFLDYCL
ncbi:uncharacterized protein [Miscanthus floridulus]|uniref:uncharacterized protein isoform X2 n=1 Tax=Miscanthus floridulus TaxID=154761 RepID=UPI003459AE19